MMGPDALIIHSSTNRPVRTHNTLPSINNFSLGLETREG